MILNDTQIAARAPYGIRSSNSASWRFGKRLDQASFLLFTGDSAALFAIGQAN